MLVVISIVAWVLIGAVVGRTLFVRILGDSPRRVNVKNSINYGEHEWIDSPEYLEAHSIAIWSMVFWFITALAYYIDRPTPIEKLKAKEQELKELEDNLAKFIKERN